MVDLKKTKSDLILQMEKAVISIQLAAMPTEFETYKINTFELKNQSFVEQLASKLPKQGSHIYWFEIDKPSELMKQFKSKSINAKYKFARDNKGTDSGFLYVGSCTKTKLSDRFKQHCGWGNDQTYSLQLKKWINDTELVFTFTYVAIESSFVVQYLEDQLHRELNPLFGKSGGNNKIQILV